MMFSEATRCPKVIVLSYELNLKLFRIDLVITYVEQGCETRLNCRCHIHRMMDDQRRQYCSLALYSDLPSNRIRAMFRSNI